MELGILSWALPACLGVLLVSAGVEDARTREIANWKNAAIALLAPVWWFAIGLDPWPMIAIQLGVALFVFALFCGAFALGQMGGGDVKLIGALALWLTPMNVMNMLIVMSIAGGALTIVFLLDHKLLRREGAIEIPYGVAIALAGLLALREPLVNQFT
ncbi:prepilin peptidase [uncultured Sphingomonas sp.]|uniref:A24 family peptidase n=1 Tax=uncultured Sphingomonas sp. TaxID=158754 RepID=UPI0025D0CA5A|nr:prepilin peptidase [uncultured Sphingomonas sp.]